MSLGKKIKELREINNKTQLDVAKYLDVTYQTIYKYEKDIAIPPADAIVKLAEYFNVTTDYLLGRTDKPNEKNIEDEKLIIAARSDVDLSELTEDEQKYILDFIKMIKNRKNK